MGILVHRSEDETEIGAGQSSALSDAGYGGTIWQKKRSASCGRGVRARGTSPSCCRREGIAASM
jgi:hypothetical protein